MDPGISSSIRTPQALQLTRATRAQKYLNKILEFFFLHLLKNPRYVEQHLHIKNYQTGTQKYQKRINKNKKKRKRTLYGVKIEQVADRDLK